MRRNAASHNFEVQAEEIEQATTTQLNEIQRSCRMKNQNQAAGESENQTEANQIMNTSSAIADQSAGHAQKFETDVAIAWGTWMHA